MKKQLFIDSINVLRDQALTDITISETIKELMPDVFDDSAILLDSRLVVKQLIKILEMAMNDYEGWIKYYIYELDFGRLCEHAKIEIRGNFVSLKTAEDLYNLIMMC